MQYMEITFLCSSSVIPAVLTQQFGVHPISWWFQTFLSPLVIGRYNQTNAILWYVVLFVLLPPSYIPQIRFSPCPPPLLLTNAFRRLRCRYIYFRIHTFGYGFALFNILNETSHKTSEMYEPQKF